MNNKTMLVLIPININKVENLPFIQTKLQDYFGQRMIKDIDPESPAIELTHSITDEDRNAIDKMAEGTDIAVLEICGDDQSLKYDNIMKVTIDVK